MVENNEGWFWIKQHVWKEIKNRKLVTWRHQVKIFQVRNYRRIFGEVGGGTTQALWWVSFSSSKINQAKKSQPNRHCFQSSLLERWPWLCKVVDFLCPQNFRDTWQTWNWVLVILCPTRPATFWNIWFIWFAKWTIRIYICQLEIMKYFGQIFLGSLLLKNFFKCTHWQAMSTQFFWKQLPRTSSNATHCSSNCTFGSLAIWRR